jgi:hypothetical protein
MDRQEFEDKLGDAVASVLEKGFYEEDLGPFSVIIDYRQDNEENNEQRT